MQFKFFIQDVKRILNGKTYRLIYIWFNRNFVGILFYRLERSLYLTFGKSYKFLRILIIPLVKLAEAYSNIDIHYEADVKGGLLILHPSMGCTISKYTSIGSHLTITGGNVIGVKNACSQNNFTIGTGCTLGANAVIIGPLHLANNVLVGASACVITSFLDSDISLVGVPAKILKEKS